MSAPEPRRPSGAELVQSVALAALARAPQSGYSVKISDDNTKGEVHVTVSGDGPDLEALGQSVQAEFDRLRLAYPRANGGAT